VKTKLRQVLTGASSHCSHGPSSRPVRSARPSEGVPLVRKCLIRVGTCGILVVYKQRRTGGPPPPHVCLPLSCAWLPIWVTQQQTKADQSLSAAVGFDGVPPLHEALIRAVYEDSFFFQNVNLLLGLFQDYFTTFVHSVGIIRSYRGSIK